MKRFGALVAVGLAFVVSIGGLSLEPLNQTFTPSQSGRIRTFRVVNTQGEQIAVRVRMLTRSVDEAGNEVRGDASGEFLVFPSTLTLPAGGSQAIRVQWLGPEEIAEEKAYRIVVEQVPVDFADEVSGGVDITIVFRYIGSVYVKPPGAKPDLVLAESVREFNETELVGMRLVMANQGTAHGIPDDLSIRLDYHEEQTGVTESIELGPEDLPAFYGHNFLAGTDRSQSVEIPSHWKLGHVEPSVRYRIVQ
jgi:fimbrial chaperone protein